MALRQIVYYPDEILNQQAEEVTEFDESLRTLVADMAETMYASDGLGLAANQVGIARRVFVVDVGQQGNGQASLRVFVNPRIVEQQGRVSREEGCLSLPGLYVEVERAEQVVMQAQDEHGQPFETSAEGMFARALQHELDHLDGVTIVDRLGRLSRKLALRRYQKLLAEHLADEGAQRGQEGTEGRG